MVQLTGEAYFEVATLRLPSGQKMPFTVNIPPSTAGVGGGRVEVLGTHFNVNAYDDDKDTKVTLLEGKVRVVKESGGKKYEVGGKKNEVMLKPGEQAVIASHSPLTIHHSPNIQ